MNQFKEYFRCDKEAFKTYVKNLTAYNNELEKVFVAIIDEIKTRSLGKQINKVFANRVIEAFPAGTVDVAIGSASMFDNNKKISVRILTKKFGGMEYKIENELLTNVSFRNKADYYREANVTYDNRFTDDSIGEIVSVINANRNRVARLQDAVEHMEEHLTIIENATKKFAETMETVNSVFIDINKIYSLVDSSCVPNLSPFKYDKYNKELDKNVEPFNV